MIKYTTQKRLIHLKIGFTLAEVLITLGIIGVVAAMTIPGLLAKYKSHQLRSRFFKSYSTIQQVFKYMQEDDVSIDPSTYAHATFYKTFANYLQGVTDCGNYGNKCFGVELRTVVNNNLSKKQSKDLYYYLDDGVLLLSDGTVLLFENLSLSRCFITVDLNGYYNPPNSFGHDLFTFQLIDEELKLMGDKNTLFEDSNKYCNFDGGADESYNGIACAYRVKNESDYFDKLLKKFK